MPVWIGLHLPHLALESFRPTWSAFTHDRGLVVLDKDRVVAIDEAADSLGIRLGMRRGGVLTLASEADIRNRDMHREADILRGLAFALMRYTPLVVLDSEDAVTMDIGASLRLFRGLRSLRRQVRRTVEALGVTANVSVAKTARAAWLMARTHGGSAQSRKSIARMQHHMPLMALPPARRYAEWFDGLGCETLADLQRLPRAGLKKRCGTALLDLVDQTTGESPEVNEWLKVALTFDARKELPDRIEHADAALFSARRLILQMTGWLTAKQLSIARYVVFLEHERGRDAIAPTELDIALAEPTWREEHLVRLLKERLGRVELAAPVIAIRIEARDVREAEASSDQLFPEPGGTPQDHARLMELLVARLGVDNVRRARPSRTIGPKSRRDGYRSQTSRSVSHCRRIYRVPRGCWTSRSS